MLLIYIAWELQLMPKNYCWGGANYRTLQENINVGNT